VVVVIEEIMQFGHEQLDVYRVSLEYAVRVSWVPYGDYDNDNENECCGPVPIERLIGTLLPTENPEAPFRRGKLKGSAETLLTGC
ncbi:MAG: hypothetical protein JRK53_19235, partial [Deltaproteobacteria bacterium]|nr:hypothetical protein [Deltaproteobacteria bacterium]